MNTHKMYVCEYCNWAQYHPLSYCLKCPGKLVKKDVEHPYPVYGHSFKTEKERTDWLATQNIKYTDEYDGRNNKVLQDQLSKMRAREWVYRYSLQLLKPESERELSPEKLKHMLEYWEKLGFEQGELYAV